MWFAVRGGRAAVYYGRLAADGTPTGEVRSLPDERAEHADVATSGESVAIVWRSFDGERTRLRAWTSKDEGRRFALSELGSSFDDNDHPRLAYRGAEVFSVWRTRGQIHVHKIL